MWNPFAKSPPPPPTQVNPASGPDIRPLPAPIPPAPLPAPGASSTASPAPTSAASPSLPFTPPTDIASVEMMGEIAIATLHATELSQEAGAQHLSELLLELSETGARHFVLDVQAVQFMDSACLGCLVEALNRLSTRGGSIALANSNHSVHYIFRLTRLDRVFMICSDVMSAMAAVEKAAADAA